MRRFILCTTSILGLSLIAGPSLAGQINVDTTAPTSATQCALAQAVAVAQEGASIGACVWRGEAIVKLSKGNTYLLDGALPPIVSTIKISGDFSIDDRARIEWSSGASGRFFDVTDQGALDLTHLTLVGGQADFGGAIRIQAGGSAELLGIEITGSTATWNGGAIYNEGRLTLLNSSLTDNQAAGLGGALHNLGTAEATVQKSLLASSSAIQGGAIYHDGGPLIVENTTFSANTSILGGGLHQKSGSTVIDFSTFRNNDAAAGGTLFLEWGSVSLGRSVLTSNDATDLCWGSGYLTSTGNNAFSDSSCSSPGSPSPETPDYLVGEEIQLSELVFHGGLTQVHVPRCDWTLGGCDSPIIDRIEKGYCYQGGSAARDQRDQDGRWDPNTGIPAQQPTCDIGSYESICESHDFVAGTRSILLHEYQVSSLTTPIILDSGACFIHPSCNPAEGCERIEWRTDLGRISILDVIFLDPTCVETNELDCFDDPDSCLTCATDPPNGWLPDPDAAPGSFAFTVEAVGQSLLGGKLQHRRAGRGMQKSSGGELVPYLIEVEDSSNPGESWLWDPQTPVLEDDVLEVP